ncbi:MAG: GNAT family N-acetyltransferase [Anaerolineaceae bacterium]|nr:GNAT family N-acetyltransferase [Anaerolineaceae bacterium]
MMRLDNLRFIHQPPDVPGYTLLRNTTGWDTLPDEVMQSGLHNSLFGVSVFDGDQIVGCGRVIGDGAMYVYIQDCIVLPEYQGLGIGSRIMHHLMGYITTQLPDCVFVGLMAAKDAAGFYEKFGFICRPQNRPGMFMEQ